MDEQKKGIGRGELIALIVRIHVSVPEYLVLLVM